MEPWHIWSLKMMLPCHLTTNFRMWGVSNTTCSHLTSWFTNWDDLGVAYSWTHKKVGITMEHKNNINQLSDAPSIPPLFSWRCKQHCSHDSRGELRILSLTPLQIHWYWIGYLISIESTTLWFCQNSYGKSPCLMGKLTISMAIFNSYVSLPEGNITKENHQPTGLNLASPQLSLFFSEGASASLLLGHPSWNSWDNWWFFAYPSEQYEKWWSESHLGWWHSQLNGKIKNVPNHQPDMVLCWFAALLKNSEWDNMSSYLVILAHVPC